MKLYVGLKFIRAEEMGRAEAVDKGLARGTEAEPDEPGYKVVYPDGYESWSPKEVFEAAYRLVTAQEIDFVKGSEERS